MSHKHLDDEPFPKGALIAAGTLISFCLVLAAGMSWGWFGVSAKTQPATEIVQVALTFNDRDEGGVAVHANGQAEPFKVLLPGEHGFIRGVMRGLVRQRRLQGIGDAEAFSLSRTADGQLWITDPATDEAVFLGAFGPTNEQAFAQLLHEGTRIQ